MKEENSKKIGYDRKCDIWSLGMMCYQMLTGKNPFALSDMKELVNKMEEGYYFLPTNISEETLSFINGMLQYDSKKRYDINDLCKHDFINKTFF